MSVIICPGIHSSALTEQFLTAMGRSHFDSLIFPTDHYPAYSGRHIFEFLCYQFRVALTEQTNDQKMRNGEAEKSLTRPAFPICNFAQPSAMSDSSSPYSLSLQEAKFDFSLIPALVFVAFSAGVVGAIAAARLWQAQGGSVKALIALDGWGVPLYGKFPIHRLSHDYFTHWSSALLGSGCDNFYADPAVEHLDLWRSPQQTQGWQERSPIQLTGKAGLSDRKTSLIPTTATQFLRSLLNHYGEAKV